MSGAVASERPFLVTLVPNHPPTPTAKGNPMVNSTDPTDHDRKLAVYRLHSEGLLSRTTYLVHNEVIDYASGIMSDDVTTKLEALFAVSDDMDMSVALVRQHCELATHVADAVLIAKKLSNHLVDHG